MKRRATRTITIHNSSKLTLVRILYLSNRAYCVRQNKTMSSSSAKPTNLKCRSINGRIWRASLKTLRPPSTTQTTACTARMDSTSLRSKNRPNANTRFGWTDPRQERNSPSPISIGKILILLQYRLLHQTSSPWNLKPASETNGF